MEDSKSIKCVFDKLMEDNDTVFIVPHNRPDFDALGAAIGISLICKKNKKKNYIVIDDSLESIELETRRVLEEMRAEFDVIRSSDIPLLITPKSLMVAVDVNKKYMICTENYLPLFKNILVIDHHKTDEKTIETPYLFVDEKLSSTCEEISRLIFLYGVKLTPDHANYLLAGIILDTNKLSKNTSQRTYAIASKLTDRGADPTVANNMFLEDFEHDRAIQRLVDNTDFPNYVFAIASDIQDSGKIYEVEDIAKASDYLLKYKVNATFAMAYIDEEGTVSISARSKGLIDVSKIMRLFGGGGNEHSAAARVKGKTLDEIKLMLSSVLVPGAFVDNYSLNIGQEVEEGNVLKLVLKGIENHE